MLAASPILVGVWFLRGLDPARSAAFWLAAAVGWPSAAFAAVQFAHLLAVAATARAARRWVAALAVAASTAAVSRSPRSLGTGVVAALALAAAALSWRLESGLGPLAPALKVPPGPGV